VCATAAHFLQNLQVQRERLSAMHHYGRKKSQILGGIIHGSSGEAWADVCLITLFVISDNSNAGLIISMLASGREFAILLSEIGNTIADATSRAPQKNGPDFSGADLDLPAPVRRGPAAAPAALTQIRRIDTRKK
jgi:hypothetical protein